MLVLFAFFGNSGLYGQSESQKANDSLLKVLHSEKYSHDDTNTVNLLGKIALNCSNFNPDDGIDYSNRCLMLSKKLDWKEGCRNAYFALTINYYNKSDLSKALEYSFLGLKVNEELRNVRNIASCLANIGAIYSEQGNETKAMEYYLKALKIREEQGDKANIASTLMNIGISYNAMRNLKKALESYQRSLTLAEELKDENLIASNISCIAEIYSQSEQLDSALGFYFRSLEILRKMGRDGQVAICFNNIGGVYAKIARNCSGNDVRAAGNHLNRVLLLQRGHAYIDSAILMEKSINELTSLRNCYLALSQIDSLQGDYEGALNAYMQYGDIKDSIFSINSNEKLGNLETERALLVKEKQIEADRRDSVERKLFFAVMGLLVLIIFIVVFNFLKQKKLTAQKAGLVDEKEELLYQKGILIKEIHHRVKNNLQVISALLDLQSGSTIDEEAKRTMTEGASRVKSIWLMHQLLYQHDDITGIEYARFVKDLFRQVAAVFKKTGQTVLLTGNMPEIVLDIDTVVPLGLIVNELMTNSFKYAFPNSDGNISINLEHNETSYKLSYSDGGPGLPKDYNIKKAISTGMTIMRNLTKQLGGTFSYDYDNGCFVILFKDLLERKKIK